MDERIEQRQGLAPLRVPEALIAILEAIQE